MLHDGRVNRARRCARGTSRPESKSNDSLGNARPDGCAGEDIAGVVQAEYDAGQGDQQRERYEYPREGGKIGDADNRERHRVESVSGGKAECIERGYPRADIG